MSSNQSLSSFSLNTQPCNVSMGENNSHFHDILEKMTRYFSMSDPKRKGTLCVMYVYSAPCALNLSSIRFQSRDEHHPYGQQFGEDWHHVSCAHLMPLRAP